MLVGSVKKTGKVRHAWALDFTGSLSGDSYYKTLCRVSQCREDRVGLKSTAPPCKKCVAILKADRSRANKALAKLGVKP